MRVGVILQTVKDKRNTLRKIKRRKANWIGHTLPRSCLVKYIMKGKLEERIYGKTRKKA
jgi:hypothetical protein